MKDEYIKNNLILGEYTFNILYLPFNYTYNIYFSNNKTPFNNYTYLKSKLKFKRCIAYQFHFLNRNSFGKSKGKKLRNYMTKKKSDLSVRYLF